MGERARDQTFLSLSLSFPNPVLKLEYNRRIIHQEREREREEERTRDRENEREREKERVNELRWPNI